MARSLFAGVARTAAPARRPSAACRGDCAEPGADPATGARFARRTRLTGERYVIDNGGVRQRLGERALRVDHRILKAAESVLEGAPGAPWRGLWRQNSDPCPSPCRLGRARLGFAGAATGSRAGPWAPAVAA